jgi:putative hydrolase of the HAD superfamily
VSFLFPGFLSCIIGIYCLIWWACGSSQDFDVNQIHYWGTISFMKVRTTPMELRVEDNLIRGIVLDAVGTLIKPVPSVAEAYAVAARRQGVGLETEVLRDRFELHFQNGDVHGEQGALSTNEATERRRWRKIVAGVLPEVPEPDRAFEELWAHFGRHESWRCFPDAAPALAALSELGICVCIGSNFDSRLRGVVQGLPELSPMVNSLIISSEVGYRKPHPLFFRAACAHLGLPGDRVLCVGDNLENDVQGAIDAGLSALLLDRRQNLLSDLPHVLTLTALIETKFIRA